MNPAEQLKLWHSEISEEIEQLEGELAEARSAFATSDADHRTALGGWSELRDTVARGVGRDAIPAALADRLDYARREALQDVSHARGVARGLVKSLEERIAGRRLALAQIDRALSTEKVTPLRAAAESQRRKAHAIEFDNIVRPQERVNAP